MPSLLLIALLTFFSFGWVEGVMAQAQKKEVLDQVFVMGASQSDSASSPTHLQRMITRSSIDQLQRQQQITTSNQANELSRNMIRAYGKTQTDITRNIGR